MKTALTALEELIEDIEVGKISPLIEALVLKSDEYYEELCKKTNPKAGLLNDPRKAYIAGVLTGFFMRRESKNES